MLIRQVFLVSTLFKVIQIIISKQNLGNKGIFLFLLLTLFRLERTPRPANSHSKTIPLSDLGRAVIGRQKLGLLNLLHPQLSQLGNIRSSH